MNYTLMPNNWSIFCPGKSLDKVPAADIRHEYLPMNSIAVNGAILKDFPVYYWAMSDPEVFETIAAIYSGARYFQPELRLWPVLWIPRNWEDHKKQYFSGIALKKFNKFRKETFAPGDGIKKLLPFDLDIDWQLTIFKAIALAVVKGARTIRLYGADMHGEGYFKNDLNNSRTRHNQKRWQGEHADFDKLKERCAECGIMIIRIIDGEEFV